jgi:hypothetical protein
MNRLEQTRRMIGRMYDHAPGAIEAGFIRASSRRELDGSEKLRG